MVDWREGLWGFMVDLLGDEELASKAVEEWLRNDLLRVSQGPYRPYKTIVVESLRSALKVVGAEYKDEYGLRLIESIGEWPPFGDTRAGIERLREHGFKVYIVSNIDNDVLERTLGNIGVEFDGYYTAEMAKAYKPNPAVIFNAYKKFGVPVWRGLHVSSSLEYDLRPAIVIGLKTAWVNRYGEPEPEEGIAVDYIASNLEELVEEVVSGSGGRDLSGWLRDYVETR